MLDPKIAGLARRMIRPQFEDRRKQILWNVQQITDQFTLQGAGRSGRLVVEIRELCAREVEIRAMMVWKGLLRVMSNLGVQPAESLSIALQNEVEGYSSEVLCDLDEIVNKHMRLVGFTKVAPLSAAWDHAMKKVYAEMDLFVSSLVARTQREEDAGSSKTVLNIYSPVGIIQTGTGAAATLVQNLDSNEQDALVRALELVRQGLGASAELAELRREMSELIEEGQSEIKKPKPNGMRLQSILTTIATTVQTVGSLQPAYQTLKAALLPLGIFLP